MSMIRIIFAIALSLGCATACMAPEPPPEPFNTGPYGPGLEVDLPGDKLELSGADGSVRYNLRIGDAALRVYDSIGVRLGTIAIIDGQLKIAQRDGSEVCTALERDRDSLAIVCGDDVEVAAAHADGTWSLNGGELGHQFSISTSGESIYWNADADDISGVVELEDDRVALLREGETLAALTGRSRRPRKELALLLGVGHVLTDSTSDTDALAWFSAAWIAVQSLEDDTVEPR